MDRRARGLLERARSLCDDSPHEVLAVIADIIFALLYWLLGVLFALCAFCAIGCVLGLFLSVLTAFKVPSRLLSTPLWVFFSFLALGLCWVLQWSFVGIGSHSDHPVQYWFYVGAVIPGVLCATLVPKLMALATGAGRTGMAVRPLDAPKV